MIYLTYNDQPSGVYTSQVCDVCHYLNNTFEANIKLVAFISLRNFKQNRGKIKSEFANSLVIPALPKAKYTQLSTIIFIIYCLLTGERKVIARNVIATIMALSAKRIGVVKTVCLDGRGAIAAEWNEYQVVGNEKMKQAISGQEKIAVSDSDFKLAVSSKLVDHWRNTYNYSGNEHVVVPCSLNSGFKADLPAPDIIRDSRNAEGYAENDIVLVYSGSTAGWQSFNVLGTKLGELLIQSKQYKLLFLSGEDENIIKMKERFPGQVKNKWVKHSEVQSTLSACDYGILFREPSVTNKVASPTKFAEYLSAGLPVIISENLGDYSDFVHSHQCGVVLKENDRLQLSKPSLIDKQKSIQLAESHFTKEANKNNYKVLIDFLKTHRTL